MGKRYYCDYCDKTMSCAPSIIRTHNSGLLHQRSKQEHFQKFKDPETILNEEMGKKQCARYPYGQCQFGSICRFSHYSPESIQFLQNYVASKRMASTMATQPSFHDLFNKLQTEKSCRSDGNTILVDEYGVTHTLPWTNEMLNNYGDIIPPSARPINLHDFSDVSLNAWG